MGLSLLAEDASAASSSAAASPAADTYASEGPSLNWWQQRQLPVLASAENSGVVLLLGGAEGSAALRCSVLLPLLLLQHGWAPQPTHNPWEQQHILVAVETSSSADSAAAAAKAWGGGCYASWVATHKGILRSSRSASKDSISPPRLVYLTTRQLLQRLLQQPLLPGCCVAAVEVSLQHSFSTELLLPLLQKVRQKRPSLRLLLLLPPASVQPHWALQLTEFFAGGEDPEAPGTGVMPQGALDVLRAAVQQQQELLLRFLTPKGGRWDVKHQQQKHSARQQIKGQRPSPGSHVRATATTTTPPPQAVENVELLEISSRSSRRSSRSSSNVSCIASDEVMVLGVTTAQDHDTHGRFSKRKKTKRKDKKKLQQRLRKVQRKLEKFSSNSAINRNLVGGEAVCIQTDTLDASRRPAQFVHEASHAVHPEGSSGEEASPVRRDDSSLDVEARGDGAAEAPKCTQPKCITPEASATSLRGQRCPGGSSASKTRLLAVSVLSLAPPTHPVAVRYLKKPTSNFVRAAAAVVSRLVASATEDPASCSSFGSIFVFVPSPEDVTALTELLQKHLQQLLKQQQQQQQPEECPQRPVEIVCLAPDLSPSLPPPSSALRIIISSGVFPPCVSPHALPVKFVVDCVYTRKTVFDSYLRLNRVCNVPISGAIADLRASLAGRATEGGCCFRLCTADAFAAACCRGAAALAAGSATAYRTAYEEFPSSALDDIAPLLLRLKVLGMHSLQRLPLLQPPPAAAVSAAAEHLLELQAVDESGHITRPLGWMMAQGILSPELTRLLLIAADKAFGCSIEAAALCALLSGPPVWQRSALEACGFSAKEAARDGSSHRASGARQQLTLSRAVLGAIEGDPLTALNVFNSYMDVKRTEGPAAASRWAERHLVDEYAMSRAANIHRAVLQWLQLCQLPCLSCDGDCKPLLRALAAAFCLNVAQRTHRHTYRLYRLVLVHYDFRPASSTSPPFIIHPSSVLANCRPSFVVYGQAFMRDGCVYMQQVTAIESQWLPEVAGHLYAVKA
ncbi:helicase associated domain-containing protein, putative [Eimeria mitis]|uniref:Helicase associated domain-containing protein, putative n=1 Tax=Eimeria mitis TaxID=44415 RepID=U6JTM9_9EIME|nr:helicase associated domain-containing protein, putative [Eimeria mitis]CDJ26848.1 helicase associated domain-containing protein, putative [Eimeria mitis]